MGVLNEPPFSQRDLLILINILKAHRRNHKLGEYIFTAFGIYFNIFNNFLVQMHVGPEVSCFLLDYATNCGIDIFRNVSIIKSV